MADASTAITNGFETVFGSEFVRVTCWAHANRAYEKRLLTVKDEKSRKVLNDEIHLLQLCHDKESFQQMCKLWLKKWKGNNDAKEFMSYFKDTWLDRNEGWYEGHAPGYPSTNNGLESINRCIKDEHTLRSRLRLGHKPN